MTFINQTKQNLKCLPFFQFIFEASVEGLPKVTKVNTQARRFGPVKVFVGDPWYPAVSGLIKNLIIETRVD